MFVHDPNSMGHIFFNMLALFIFGSQVERQMGSREFLLYYLLTGILAGVFSFFVYWLTGARGVLLMGASGAIYAVQLAYAVFFPRSVIYIWGLLPLRAPVMVLGFTIVGIVMMVTGLGGNVAHFTHLAGFAFGWFYFLLRFGVNPWKAMRS
jgi:membrane associated rhomboid family serine protease